MTLGDFVTLQRGHDLPESKRRPGNVPVIGSFGITGYHDTAKAKGPGVTIGRSGASFGVVSYCPVNYWPHNAALYVTDFHGNDERFSYYFLKSIDFKNYNSDSAQPSLNRNYIYPIEIKVPPLPTQRKIAAILSAYDDLIENNTRRIEILEEMARSLYREWFVNFRFPGYEQVKMVDSELGLIPEGWEVKKLDKLGLLGRGKSKHRPRNEPSLYGGDYPFIQTGEVKEASLYITHYSQTYNEKGLAQSKLWGPKTLLLTIAANIAETAILTIPACFPDSIVGFVADSEQVTPEFIKFRIDDIKEKMQSFSRGTAQDNLSLDKIKLFDFLVSDKDCIRLFDKYTAPLFSLVQNLLLKNANLRQTRDLLLSKLISGEIDVENLDINTGEIAA